MSQLALDLSQPPAFRREDFLVASCNQEAHGWIDRWPAWPGFALAVAGPPGSGKSHLAHIFAERSSSLLLSVRSLSTEAVGDLDLDQGVVIEDADQGINETALFHLFNILKERQRPLMLTGRDAPSRWGVSLPDLRSRLATLPVAEIGPPDDVLLQALLVKLFADRQLRIGPEVTAYLLPRMERSFASVRNLVERLDLAALEAGRAVTLPLIRTVVG